MPTYTPITTPENQDARVLLEAYIDADGDLGLRTTDDASEEISSHVAIGCDDGQLVRTVVRDFEDSNGTTWTVSATPKLSSSSAWDRDGNEAYDEVVGWTDFVEVDLTATAADGTSKKKKIHVQTKSRKELPIRTLNLDD